MTSLKEKKRVRRRKKNTTIYSYRCDIKMGNYKGHIFKGS